METTPKTSPQEAKTPATAAGQYLGYSLQQTLLATRLRLAAAGSACSLEVLDDVAEQAADGTTHLIQSKSALTDNPVADRAVSLWKTLYNWLELVKLKLVDSDTTTFEIHVSQSVWVSVSSKNGGAFWAGLKIPSKTLTISEHC